MSSSTNFAALLRTGAEHCATGSNDVPNRVDKYGLSFTSKRPWSIHESTYAAPETMKYCETAVELTDSLKQGQRILTNLNTTRFEPYNCRMRWFSTSEICDISYRYSNVIIYGDSLSRHLTQACLILLTEDTVFGALPRLSPSSMYNHCACDGQFSEAKHCRFSDSNVIQIADPRSYGICRGRGQSQPFQVHYVSPGKQCHKKKCKLDTKMLDVRTNASILCSPDPRPIAVMLQGGAHYGSRADRVIKHFLKPFEAAVKQTRTTCAYNTTLRVVWTGLNSQSIALDKKYPHQSDANATLFNDHVSQFVAKRFSMLTLDFLPLTRQADVSDGYHYLTEVNVLKAMYWYNLLHLWSFAAPLDVFT